MFVFIYNSFYIRVTLSN